MLTQSSTPKFEISKRKYEKNITLDFQQVNFFHKIDVMKNSKFAIWTFTLGLVLIAFLTQNLNAQSNKERKRAKKEKVAVSNQQKTNVRTDSPARGRTVVNVTPQARTVRYRNIDYRYHNGTFYRPQGNAFIVTRPPIGIRVNILPAQHMSIRFGNRPYYYYEGIYYDRVNDGYEVIQPPLGARISHLPQYNERVFLDGREYYLSEGIYYKTVQERDGSLVYEVAGYV